MTGRDYNSGSTDEERDEEAVEQRRRGLHIVPSPQEPPPRTLADTELRELLEGFKRPAKTKKPPSGDLPPAA